MNTYTHTHTHIYIYIYIYAKENWVGFDPCFKRLTSLVTLKSCDKMQQSVFG